MAIARDPDAASLAVAIVDEPEDPEPEREPRRRRLPPTTSEPAAPVVEPTGVVNVVTPGGWADVVVGGRVIGRTPRQFTLPAGTRSIELRPFGRTPGDRVEVTVEPGGTARVVRPVTR